MLTVIPIKMTVFLEKYFNNENAINRLIKFLLTKIQIFFKIIKNYSKFY